MTKRGAAEAVHRIRELLRISSKAEIAAWIARANERICELEAELAERETPAKAPLTYRVQRKMIMEWKARAEEAEARVAELKARVYEVAKVLAFNPSTKHAAEQLWFANEHTADEKAREKECVCPTYLHRPECPRAREKEAGR